VHDRTKKRRSKYCEIEKAMASEDAVELPSDILTGSIHVDVSHAGFAGVLSLLVSSCAE
jgi:hypothetical protein